MLSPSWYAKSSSSFNKMYFGQDKVRNDFLLKISEDTLGAAALPLIILVAFD